MDQTTLNTFDIENIDLVALLWQTGYLTFDKKVGDEEDSFYKMKIPNIEVMRSLNVLIVKYITGLDDTPMKQIALKSSLKGKDFNGLQTELTSLFASIPYINYVNNTIASYEGYYASVVFTYLASLGFDVVAEDTTNRGRIDMTLITQSSVIIIEFKVDMENEAALQQIKSKKYYEKSLSLDKDIYIIGIHFDSTIKNVSGFVCEKYL